MAIVAVLVWTLSALVPGVVLVVPACAVGVVLDPRRLLVGNPGHASPTASEGRNICDLHCSYLSVIGGSLCLVHSRLWDCRKASNGRFDSVSDDSGTNKAARGHCKQY